MTECLKRIKKKMYLTNKKKSFDVEGFEPTLDYVTAPISFLHV